MSSRVLFITEPCCRRFDIIALCAKRELHKVKKEKTDSRSGVGFIRPIQSDIAHEQAEKNPIENLVM